LIIAAALIILIQDVIYRFLSSELTLWQIFLLRGVMAVADNLLSGPGIQKFRHTSCPAVSITSTCQAPECYDMPFFYF